MTTKIEWTDETWNWMVGCSRISAGCKNCYAATAAKSARLQQFPQYQKVEQWNGAVEFVESQLLKPLAWKKPKKLFPCSMSDFFHENALDEWRDKAFAVMELAEEHTFQVLTKRSRNMLNYFRGNPEKRILRNAIRIAKDYPARQTQITKGLPFPNVWLGVTLEDQEALSSRIQDLLETPAAVRFLSVEPMLGRIDLDFENIIVSFIEDLMSAGRWDEKLYGMYEDLQINQLLHWVVCGGESGPKARPFHLEWAMDLAQQCKDEGVAFFFKQTGSNPFYKGELLKVTGKGGNLDELPDECKEVLVREFPDGKNV